MKVEYTIDIADIEEGKSYEFKCHRTTYRLIYEKTNDLYRAERIAKENYISYIIYKDIPTFYNIMTMGVANKPLLREVTASKLME